MKNVQLRQDIQILTIKDYAKKTENEKLQDILPHIQDPSSRWLHLIHEEEP